MKQRSAIAGILATSAIAFAISLSASAQGDAVRVVSRDTAMDAAINGRVAAALMSDPGLLGARIDVDTENGVVKLAGTVMGAAELHRALDIAAQVDGVRRVDNLLEVARRP
ncbi:MAG: BON domain-containing protein [Rhodocyclaceae bacterium]|nr:BON domain-containing protein [Rhodocyclaceae bacterium]